MAEDIKYSIKVDTGGVDKATNAIDNFGKATKQAVNKTSNTLGGLSERFESMPGAIGNVAGSLGGLGKSMMALAANPIGAVLTALVGIFMALKSALEKTDEGMDALEQLTSAFSAVLNPLIQAVGKFAGFLVGGLAKGLELITGLFNDNAKAGKNLAKSLQDLDDAELALNEARAKQNKDLAETRELLSDTNSTIEERRKALEKVSKSETELAAKELKNAQRREALAREDQRLNGETESSKKAISEAVIQVANAETELAAKRRLFNREQKKLDAEEEARKKELAKAEEERQKEALERAKEYAKTRRDAADKIREAQNKNILAEIQDDELRAKKQAEIEFAATKREIQQSEFNKKEKSKLLIEAEKEYQRQITQITELAEQKRIDNTKKAEQELKAFQEKAASDEQAFIDSQYQKKQLEIQRRYFDEEQLQNQSFQTEAERMQNKLQAEKQLQEELFKLETERIQNQIQAAKDAGKDTTALEAQLLANYRATNKFKQDSDNQTAENKKKAEAQALDAVSQALGGVIDLVGAESKWGKSLAVGQAIINTYLGASKAIAEGGTLGPLLAAGVVASGLAQVRQITMTKLPDPPSEFGGGGGGDAGASIPTPSFGPSVGIVSGQMGNNAQLANAFGGVMKQPIKAYAVGQDMTSQQSLDRHISQNATLGK